MSIARRAALGGLLALALAPTARADTPDLAVGQEWTIKNVDGAKALIDWIEPWDNGATAVSISVIDLPTPRGPVSIADLPFEKTVLVASLGQLLATGLHPPPDFQDAYQTWKRGTGTLFTDPVADILAAFLAQLRAHSAGR